MPELIAIDTPDDPRIAAYRDVRERDLVGRRGLFIAEGTVVLGHLIASPLCQPLSLLLAEKRVDALRPLWSLLDDTVPVYVARGAVLDAIAGFPLHRGVLALGRRTVADDADTLLRTRPTRDVMLLSAIANHDNMGGLFRNAAAFGVGAVLLDHECCDPLYRKAIRVSVGAALIVPFARLAPGEDAIALLERHAIAPVALSPAGRAALAQWQPEPRCAVMLGAEGAGLPAETLARATTIRIPMAAGFDSLNVATASGIVLHHLAAHRS